MLQAPLGRELERLGWTAAGIESGMAYGVVVAAAAAAAGCSYSTRWFVEYNLVRFYVLYLILD
jgi:hypothetical protein